jgi:hypothetical protein
MSSRHLTPLDKEKHSEVSLSSRHYFGGDDSSDGVSDEESEDGDEFGGATEDEQANKKFLRELKQDYQSEMVLSTPTLLWVTPSQLQSRLPMGLDNERHDDITDLRRGLSVSKSKRNIFADAEEDNEIMLSSDDEFRNANDSDVPMASRSLDSTHGRTLGPRAGVPSRSALFSRCAASLDVGEHEEIGHLLDSRHARGLDSLGNKRATLHHYDEFGDARSDEAPVVSYLQGAKQEMLELEGRGRSLASATSTEVEARIPEGLDRGKHEDIGNLLDSLRSARSESYGEFEDASLHDMPHRRFLYDSTHTRDFSDVEEDAEEDEHLQNSGDMFMGMPESSEPVPTGGDDLLPAGEELDDAIEYESLKGEEADVASIPEIEDSQKPGRGGLDNEAHNDLSVFRLCPSVSDDEFGSASTLDMADASFLQRQLSSMHDEADNISELGDGSLH